MRLTVTLRADEREALRVLAEQERRDLRAQAALLIRRGLEDLEFLQPLPQIHRCGDSNCSDQRGGEAEMSDGC